MLEQDRGFNREYFYSRFASAAREVVARGITAKGHEPLMMPRTVNIKQALDLLKLCPVCGSELQTYESYPMEKTCQNGCGDFTITEIWLSGEHYIYEFKLNVTLDEEVEVAHDAADEPA